MISHKSFSNPWWLVAGSAMALSVGCGTLMLFTFGILLKPVTEDMGWSREVMSIAFGAATIMTAVAMPIVGKLTDRLGARVIVIWGIPLFALSFAAISLSGVSPIVFMVLYGLAGFIGAAHTPIPYSRAIAGRIDTRLGLALGIAMAGIGVGQAILPRVLHSVVDALGWRGTYVFLGATIFVIAFPAAFLLVPGARMEQVRNPASGDASSVARVLTGLTVREALTGSPRFWLIASAVFMTAVALVGTIAHLGALLTDRGLSASFAALLLSSVGLSAMVARLVCGHLMDRFHAPYVGAVTFLLPALGLALLLINGMPKSVLFFAAVALGQGLGAESDMIGYLIRRYFGIRSFGELSGYMLAIFAVGASVGPFAMGRCFDTTHSYDLALGAFLLACVVAAALVSRIGPYVFPASAAVVAPTALSAADAQPGALVAER